MLHKNLTLQAFAFGFVQKQILTPTLTCPLAVGDNIISLDSDDPGAMGHPSVLSIVITLAVTCPPVNIAISMF